DERGFDEPSAVGFPSAATIVRGEEAQSAEPSTTVPISSGPGDAHPPTSDEDETVREFGSIGGPDWAQSSFGSADVGAVSREKVYGTVRVWWAKRAPPRA